MNKSLPTKLGSQQTGATSKGILISIGSTVFLLLAFRYRLDALAIEPWHEQVFRGVMLIYFNSMLFLIVPNLAKWLNKQDFMIEENNAYSDSIWIEYFLLALSVFFVLMMADAQITGVIAEIRRYSSGPDYHALRQPAQFWSNVIAGYVITLFSSTVYWQMRLLRLNR